MKKNKLWESHCKQVEKHRLYHAMDKPCPCWSEAKAKAIAEVGRKSGLSPDLVEKLSKMLAPFQQFEEMDAENHPEEEGEELEIIEDEVYKDGTFRGFKK